LHVDTPSLENLRKAWHRHEEMSAQLGLQTNSYVETAMKQVTGTTIAQNLTIFCVTVVT